MPELEKDVSVIDIVDNKIRITRTVVEVYDAEEYIRRTTKLEFEKEQFQEGIKAIDETLELMNTKRKEAEAIRAAEIEAVKQARDKKERTNL